MKRLSRVVVVAAVALGGFGIAQAPAQAGTHIVHPGQSIQAAVDAATAGDTIRLEKGTYRGDVVMRKSVTIRGAGEKTILIPGSSANCSGFLAGSGICVVGTPAAPVRGVTIECLRIKGFGNSAVIGFQTDQLRVRCVHAEKNGEYGIASFAGTRTEFSGNLTEDSGEAGLYVGDMPDTQGTVVTGNVSSGNNLGILARHVHHVRIDNNEVHENCAGIALVDDGQAGGMGDIRITNNVATSNNRSCASHEEAPALKGTGILAFGGVRNTISSNVVSSNRGNLPHSGGIVLVPGPAGNARGNTVAWNVLMDNAPRNLVDRNAKSDNQFIGNL